MASRLAESGYDLVVYNRTRSKSDEVAQLGARVAGSPAEAAADADVVMLSLADQDVVASMLRWLTSSRDGSRRGAGETRSFGG